MRMQDETGTIPDDAWLRAREHVDRMSALTPFGTDAAGISNSTWTWLGPGNIGGRIRAIAIDPTTPSTVFIGSVGGGIWKSVNSGASWTPINDFMANLAISSIVFNPVTPSTMYAGTGEGFYNFGRLRGAGILASTDSGTTWSILPSTAGSDFHYVHRIAISANGAVMLAGTWQGLFRSTDGGASWTRVLTPAVGFPDMLDVKFLPGSSTAAVASGFSKNAFYSTDAGASWTPAAGLTPQAGAFYRVEIGVSVSSPGTVYLSVDAGAGPSLPGEVWKSIDGGVSYAVTPSKPDHLDAQGYFDNTIWVDPTNPNRVVVGGTRLASTTDGGATWTRRDYGAGIPPDTHVLVSDPGYNGANNRRLYVGNDSGIYLTTDITASPFTSVVFSSLNNGLGITQLYGAAGNATSGKIVAGAQDNGTLLYSPSSGTNWTSVFGFDGGYVAADPANPDYFYGENAYLKLHRNSTGGAVSSVTIYGDASGVCKGAPYSLTDACTNAANYVAPFVLDPNNPNTLLAGGNSLWRTTDVKAAVTPTTGPSWAAIKPPDSSNGYISTIAVAPGDSNVIWVGHNSGAIYKTTTGTSPSPVWINVGSGTLPGRFLSRIAIDSANNNIVYAAFAGFSSPNLWKSIDGGGTWTAASGSGATALPPAPIYSVALHPTIAGWVYAGTEVGLFASTDGGATWSLPHDGPANVSVEDLAWIGGRLAAATHGRGLFVTACNYTLAPTAASVAATGGGGTVTVTTSSGACVWTPSSNAAWLTATGSGAGDGSFTYTAAANPGGQRAGTITVGTATFVVTQAGSATAMSVNRTALSFGARNSGGTLTTSTGAQTVTVTFGSGAPSWTATTTTPWLQISGGSGAGNGQFMVSVMNAAGLPSSGSVSGSVTVAAAGITNSPQTIAVTLTLYPGSSTAAAFGAFDTPGEGAQVAGSIAVTGWALDDIEVVRVEIWRDKVGSETGYPGGGPGQGKVFIANALFVNGARPDLETAFPAAPFNYRAGWGYLMLTWGLPSQGNGPFTLWAFAVDKEGNASVLGSRNIVSSNATATRPFGSIDTPGYGETVSGGFYNFGWALTPNATPTCTISPNGVQVSIDSGPLLPVSYGDRRDDIAAGFPGFSNGASAGGAYFIDSTTLSNGTHLIGWFVTDDCGRADGIGSRFFTVLNGSTTNTPVMVESAKLARAESPMVRRGYERVIQEDPVEVVRETGTTLSYPNPSGDRIVPIRQGERVEIRLPDIGGATYAAYHIVNGERRAMPTGSTFDGPAGMFYWQPAAGFLGAYDMEFASSYGAMRVRAVVGTAVLTAIDTPAAGAVPSSFVIAGWTIEQAAESGTGIDAVHVWAYPANGDAPIFLGVASYGDVRPDIGSIFGDQFRGASYSLAVPHLQSGTYDLVVYPHSSVAGDFRGAQLVRVSVP
jgi:hypothetical protein